MTQWYGLLEPLVVLIGLALLLYYQVWKNPYEIEKRQKRRREKAEKKAAREHGEE
ncbi:hypothetical protein FP2506_00885 [Fulvimarina pelagi HTCC2506]|uniref:Uncharacterized protein n=1 Tax=Fulvimarina pelagi HTCC2506 TaxID=314231 RepID=Q0G2C0_9HYPH|nr:hypothetical protein [Fulvimarina pelagi]EAU41278.1 hypothetical protein FP2506_00885 [Fulvimarina pelagi HTCC2506]